MTSHARGTLLEEVETGDAVHELVRFAHPEGVLSVYLDIDPATATREGYEAALMDLAKPLRAHAQDQWEHTRIEYERACALDIVRAWREPPGRSVAMFLCAPGGLSAVMPFAFPMKPVAHFASRPMLGPLIAALDEHRRYCVVAFDKSRARLITVMQERVEEETLLEADVLPRSAVGGFGGYLQARYGRHREHHLQEHARRTIDHLWAIERSRAIHGVILAGPEEPVALLKRMLPGRLRRAVVGTVALDLDIAQAAILRRVREIDAEAREREQAEIAEEILTDAAKGGRATTGWDETLQALGEGRVHLLLLPRDESGPAGMQCANEHFLTTQRVTVCPLCEEALYPVDEVREAAVRLAMRTDAEVHFGEAATRRLDGAGALLRY